MYRFFTMPNLAFYEEKNQNNYLEQHEGDNGRFFIFLAEH